MAWPAPKQCAKPGCPGLTQGRFCEAHQRDESRRYDRQRGSTSKRGYGRRWQKLRRIHAMGDDRLTREDLRLLIAIGWHDRFGANSRGCYAKHESLADETNMDLTSISRSAANLVAFGYITSERFPLDKRRRTYRLIYKEKKVILGASANECGTPDERTEKATILGASAIFQPEILGTEKQEVADSQQEKASQYILLNSRGIYDVETSIGENAISPAENHVDRNPKTRWENLAPLKTKAST